MRVQQGCPVRYIKTNERPQLECSNKIRKYTKNTMRVQLAFIVTNCMKQMPE